MMAYKKLTRLFVRPLIMMSTSGKARSNLATRVILASRSRRTRRRIVASPMPSLEICSMESTKGLQIKTWSS